MNDRQMAAVMEIAPNAFAEKIGELGPDELTELVYHDPGTGCPFCDIVAEEITRRGERDAADAEVQGSSGKAVRRGRGRVGFVGGGEAKRRDRKTG
jgi:hypothetical protein